MIPGNPRSLLTTRRKPETGNRKPRVLPIFPRPPVPFDEKDRDPGLAAACFSIGAEAGARIGRRYGLGRRFRAQGADYRRGFEEARQVADGVDGNGRAVVV